MKKALSFSSSISILVSLSVLASCASDLGSENEPDGTGGAPETGGASGSGGGLGSGGLGSGGFGAGGFGSGGTPGTGGAAEVLFSPGFQALRDVLSGFKIGRPDYSCASADCHSGGSETTMVPLRLVQDEGLYAELTTHVSSKCGNLKVVEPGSPENSALIKVLREGCADVTPPSEPIPRMPFGCVENEFENTCVDDAHIATIEQWILDGAPEF